MGRTDTNVRHAKRTPSYCHRPTTLPSTRIRHDATRMYLRLLRRARVLSCCWLCLPWGSGCISWPTRTFQSMKCPKRCINWSSGTPPSDRPTTTHRKAPRLGAGVRMVSCAGATLQQGQVRHARLPCPLRLSGRSRATSHCAEPRQPAGRLCPPRGC